MAKTIKPRFDFSQEVPQEGVGANHTSAQTPDNNLAPSKFNEYERLLNEIARAIGNYDYSDVFTGCDLSLESAIRTMDSKYKISFSNIDSIVNSCRVDVNLINTKLNSAYADMNSLVEAEAAARTNDINTVTGKVTALDNKVTTLLSSSSGDFNTYKIANDATINQLKAAVLYKTASSQTITGDILLDGNFTLSSSTSKVINFANSPVRTTYVAVDPGDLVNINTGDTRYVKQSGNGKVTGNFTITGRLIGGVPVGTIMIFDGTGWIDNSTMPGWYACIPDNVVSHGCPDLVGKFVMGSVSGSTSYPLKSSGGSKEVVLSVSNLASHTHTLAHGHGLHSHVMNQHKHNLNGITNFSAKVLSGQSVNTEISNVNVTLESHGHNVSITVPTFSENTPGISIVSGTGGALAGYNLDEHYVTDGSTPIRSSINNILVNGEYDVTVEDETIVPTVPPHSHTIYESEISDIYIPVNFSSGEVTNVVATMNTTDISAASCTVQDTGVKGDSQAFSILPPYYSAIYIRRCHIDGVDD